MPHLTPARTDAAAALRALNNAFVAHDADDGVLEAIAAFARSTAAALEQGERRDRAGRLAKHVSRMFGMEPQAEGDDDFPSEAGDVMADRAVAGPSNPTSTDFEMEMGETEAIARTTLGAAFEGAPGRAHGGMVAALFDDVTGFALRLAQTAAYTGTLSVRYIQPVPIETPLEFRARPGNLDGRKLHITAECLVGEDVVATCDAIYITIDPTLFGKVGDA
jgi:acyl-coenzyme A thioesterase PaaI-like protein